ncbi:dsDNA nuclease domain-containing protein [Vibrio methylphosphonaticus]|uniref:dsDNA nuclease domain-containing protein n=1 Tax=Vibrio methylphosphonaticus TaxID=2946866 RepID=UPI002029D1A4|nr:dsDNA nuclease domain-containing protein [Vibrio methylphosphonaticus]MCL9775737.1 dsDNA nuclease domain-containing protein [Vibrio methylphosphonaticus]
MSSTEMEQSDSGGPAALKGFSYQNFAAAYYTLSMLRDKSLLSVRCEVVDDIDLVYDDRIEYVQVKTTDDDTKWSIKEFAVASTRTVPKTGQQKKDQIVSKEDSILHKSMACDKSQLPGYFRILTTRDVKKELHLLKIDINTRPQKEGKEKLLASLRRKIKLNKPRNSTEFKTPKGNDVEYWLDHAEWTVIPNQTQLELACTSLILQAAQEQGIFLSSNSDDIRILCSLLSNLTKKSATSRVLYSAADKSYHRIDFIKWFSNEIEHYANLNSRHIKVYSTNQNKLTAIIKSFFTDRDLYKNHSFDGEKICTGLHGGYHRRNYTYGQIAKNLCQWLPQVLLLPNELADHKPENLDEKIAIYTKRKKQSYQNINELISKALLYSIIRTKYKSQPIAANLYIDDNMKTCFDNVHILLEDHSPDKLLMGFSYLIEGSIKDAVDNMIMQFDELLGSEAFDTQKEKILETKEDGYLLKHDIDEILNANSSLDENIDRFRFAFFLGYESCNLDCNNKHMHKDYLLTLEEEVKDRFKRLIECLVEQSEFYQDLHIDVYIYPIPSIPSLIHAVTTQANK